MIPLAGMPARVLLGHYNQRSEPVVATRGRRATGRDRTAVCRRSELPILLPTRRPMSVVVNRIFLEVTLRQTEALPFLFMLGGNKNLSPQGNDVPWLAQASAHSNYINACSP